jgi:hypothetical protein
LGWFFDPQLSGGFFWGDFDMLIKGMAPVFIFCMGMTLCYSKRQKANEVLRRALNMAGIVGLLELSRTIVPCSIEWLIFRDFESINYAYQFLCVDILQFVTLTLLAIAGLKKLKLGTVAMLVIAAVCSVIGQLLQGVSTGSVIGDMVAGFLWSTYDAAYFPFLNWFIVPVVGYSFGKLWLYLKDKDTFFKWVTPISCGITAIYYISMVLVGEWYYFSNGRYSGIGILDVLFMFVNFLAVAGGCYYLNKWVPRFSHVFESMGARVNSVYCIHWTIYAFLYLTLLCVMGENYLPLWTVIPVAALVVIVSDILSWVYKKHTIKRAIGCVSGEKEN